MHPCRAFLAGRLAAPGPASRKARRAPPARTQSARPGRTRRTRQGKAARAAHRRFGGPSKVRLRAHFITLAILPQRRAASRSAPAGSGKETPRPAASASSAIGAASCGAGSRSLLADARASPGAPRHSSPGPCARRSRPCRRRPRRAGSSRPTTTSHEPAAIAARRIASSLRKAPKGGAPAIAKKPAIQSAPDTGSLPAAPAPRRSSWCRTRRGCCPPRGREPPSRGSG